MALFYPVDSQVEVTDGTAAPVAADLQNFTPYHRSGGDISVANMTFQRGAMGRAADEHGYLRRYTASVSDLTLEQDDTASVGPVVLFDMANVRTENQRLFRRTYASGKTRTVNCVVTNVGDSYQDADVMLYNVSLQGTGTVTEVGL